MYSLGEIEAQCKKAAKGAGLSWGLAEEAGMAARQLTEIGLPGAEVIYITLRNQKDFNFDFLGNNLDIVGENKKPKNGLLLGVYLLDRLFLLVKNDWFNLGSVVSPLALVGVFLRLTGEKYSFSIKWNEGNFYLNELGFGIGGKNKKPEICSNVFIKVKKTINPSKANIINTRAEVGVCWKHLTILAEKTYVPASEVSRLKGAGAGVLDSD